jgi:hypothetical protein
VELRNIILAAAFAFSAIGCSDAGDDDGEADDDGPTPREFCEQRQQCTGDTICMPDGECERAFDREYSVRMNLYRPGIPSCDENPDCRPIPPVKVYYSEQGAPILSTDDWRVARIEISEGSSLVIDASGDQCEVELTADVLRGRTTTCPTQGVAVYVTMDPVSAEPDPDLPGELEDTRR